MITQSELKKLLHYDPETGLFTWLPRENPQVNAMLSGKIAGCECLRDKLSYVCIRVNGKLKLAHRLAWLYVHGHWPKGVIDHIDGNGTNNSIKNLRDVSCQVNSKNQKKSSLNKSGFPGVRPYGKNGKFRAELRVNGKSLHVGVFSSAEEAAKERRKAALKHGFHANHGAR